MRIILIFFLGFCVPSNTMEKNHAIKDYNALFLDACVHSNPKTISKLLKNGADIQILNNNQENCFHLVTQVKVARTLVDAIKKESQTTSHLLQPMLEHHNQQGKTPLANAVYDLNNDMVKYFLSLGANPQCVDNTGDSLFHELARIPAMQPDEDFGDVLVEGITLTKKENIAVLLRKYNADINAQNSLGQTPCHIIVTQPAWDTELLLTFLNLGANLSVTDIQNQSVFQLMCELGTNIKIANIFASAKLPPEESEQEHMTLQLLSLRQVIHNATNKQVIKYVKTKKNHPQKKNRLKKLITEQACSHALLHIITQKNNYPKLYPLCLYLLANKYHITRYRLIETIFCKLTKQKKGNPHIQSLLIDLIEYEQTTQVAAWEKMIALLKEPETKYSNYLIELLHRTITREYYAERAGYQKEYTAQRSANNNQNHE